MKMQDMEPQQWRAAVGEAIETRRRELYASIRAAARAAKISDGVWRQLESGKRPIGQMITVAPSPERRTKEAVCKALGWSLDSIDRLLAGDSPTELNYSHRAVMNVDPSKPPGGTIEERVTALEKSTAEQLEVLLQVARQLGVDLD